MNRRHPRQQRIAPVKRILMVQLLMSLVPGLALTLFTSLAHATAWTLGGLICLVPNLYFAYRLFSVQGAGASRQIAQAMYKGEAGKLVLTMGLFALVFSTYPDVQVLMLFAGFVSVQSMNWVAPLLNRRASPGK